MVDLEVIVLDQLRAGEAAGRNIFARSYWKLCNSNLSLINWMG